MCNLYSSKCDFGNVQESINVGNQETDQKLYANLIYKSLFFVVITLLGIGISLVLLSNYFFSGFF